MHGLQRLAPMPPPLCDHRGVLRPTKATPLGVAPPRQARTHRHRVRMTTTPEPGRLPSVRPRPRGRDRPDCAHCYTCTLQPRTLVACRDPTRPRQKARRSLQTTPRDETILADRDDTAEKMRLTDVCNRLTTRAPCEPFDSRLRLHRPCGLLRAPTRGRSRELHLGGASLDGDPPASALDAHRFATRYPV